MKGLIFSIEEFAVHDGEGLRSSIFFKGCMLRCKWCHNPEGLLPVPQRVKNHNGCLNCGRCEAACPTPDHCSACGHCAAYCPRGLIRIAGEYWEPEDLAQRIKRNFPSGMKAGVTLSGGEIFMQPEFLLALLPALRPLHRAIETSAYCEGELFSQALKELEFVFMDLKHMDSSLHRYYTGVDNQKILANLERLKSSGLPFVIRVPAIANVNDDDKNIRSVGEHLKGCKTLKYVEFLPYNVMAGAKYQMLGWQYQESFSPPSAAKLERMILLLNEMGIPARCRKPV